MDPSPDKEDPKKKPPSRDLAEFDPAEREFWDSDDDEGQAEEHQSAEEVSEKAEEAPGPGQGGHDPLDENLEDLDDLDLEDPEEIEDLEEEADLSEDSEQEESHEEPERTPESTPKEPDPESEKRRLSRKDFIWLGVLGVFLLIIGIYALSLFLKSVQPSRRPDNVDFPVPGDKIVLESIATYWRKADHQVDKVSLEADLIPCAVVKVKSGSGSGRLRFFFENDEGDYVGDPLTYSFAEGRFEPGGTDELNLYGTHGFEHEGQYAAYVTAEFKFWYVNVFEGPAADDQDGQEDEFEKLTRIRISPKRR